MNIKILEVGMEFKNYKDMCEKLGMEIKVGTNSKNAQFRELSKYCNYTKIGHKIKILEVYDSIKEVVHGNKGNTNRDIYGNLVQLLVLNYLIEQGNSVEISKTNLLQKVGLTNRNYVRLKNYPRSLANYIGHNIIYVYDFYNVNDSKLKRIVERALHNLADKSLIFFSEIIKVKTLSDTSTREATEFEMQLILSARKEVLEELGFEDMNSVRRSNKWGEFSNKVDSILSQSSDIEYFYTAYAITINTKFIEKEQINLENTLYNTVLNGSFDKKSSISEVNSLISEGIMKSTEERNADVEKYFNDKAYRLSDEYIVSSDKLCRILILKETKNLTNDILNSKGEMKEVPDLSSMLPF